jgi:glycine/D-amino acid oxidase-like deaminating enzyme/nitrite reductase/ring-hydroxylating ferredoxin subunit
MKSASVWRRGRLPTYGKLKASRQYDVAIVGGGICGLSAAYLLKRAGRRVCLLERERIGAVDTGNTSAHLTHVTDLRLAKLAKAFGDEAARLAWGAGAAAINTIEEIVAAEEIECNFRRVPGFLHAAIQGKKDESAALEDEARLGRELGFDATFLPAVPYLQKPGIRFADQARFQPLKYLAGLAKFIHGDGSDIFEQTGVSEVESEPIAVKANGHRVECDWLVIATHVPLMGAAGLIGATLFQSKLAPYTSYVVGATIRKGLLPEASFWDTADPYYYLRVDGNASSDYLIFGGEDHKTGQVADTEDCFARLAQTLVDIVPEARITHRWSGQVIETNDGLPYIGQTAERQFVATGFAGNGMTFGTVGAMMACDAVLGRKSPWQDLFSVSRKKLRGGTWDYIKENLDYPYYLVKGHLTFAAKSTRAVARGDGQVLKLNGQRVACSRDENGKLTTVSAVCTHMGCIVRWNPAEKTWDCPCHGSRFHANGEVLAGPAESPLEPVSQKPKRKKKPASARTETRRHRRSASPRKGR